MTLLAVRLIDLAIFGSLGGLWIGGAIFIVMLYRWILRFERGDDSADSAGDEPLGDAVPVIEPEPERPRGRPSMVAHPVAARLGLQAVTSET